MEECKMRQTIMQDFRMLGMLLVAGSAKTGDATTPNGNGSMNPIVGFKEKIAATGTTWNSSYHWTSTELVGGAWSVIYYLPYDPLCTLVSYCFADLTLTRE